MIHVRKFFKCVEKVASNGTVLRILDELATIHCYIVQKGFVSIVSLKQCSINLSHKSRVFRKRHSVFSYLSIGYWQL